MLSKYFTLILTFNLILLESRHLLGFYCIAFLVYDILLLPLILTPSFSCPLSEENAVGMNNKIITLNNLIIVISKTPPFCMK